MSTVRPSGTRAISAFHDVYGDYVLSGDVTYEADVWGRIHGLVETSRTAAQATAADLETARLSLHAELARKFAHIHRTARQRIRPPGPVS